MPMKGLSRSRGTGWCRDLEALERTPGATFAEARALREKIEHLELQIIWFQNAPKRWFE